MESSAQWKQKPLPANRRHADFRLAQSEEDGCESIQEREKINCLSIPVNAAFTPRKNPNCSNKAGEWS